MIPIKKGTARKLGLVLPQRKKLSLGTAAWFDGDPLRRPDLAVDSEVFMAFDVAGWAKPLVLSVERRSIRILDDHADGFTFEAQGRRV